MWPLYDSIRCPTLITRGAQSDLLSRETAEEMTHRGPRARLVEFRRRRPRADVLRTDQIDGRARLSWQGLMR
jgi:pimeloyl-ACP methyl ester carboxylesterase